MAHRRGLRWIRSPNDYCGGLAGRRRGVTGRIGPLARVAELADAEDSKSSGREVVRVQVPPRAPDIRRSQRFQIPEYGRLGQIVALRRLVDILQEVFDPL